MNWKRWICFFIQWVCYQLRRWHSSGLRACIMEISVQHCTSSPAFSNGLLSLRWKSTIAGCSSPKYLSSRGALLLHCWIFHLAGSVMVKDELQIYKQYENENCRWAVFTGPTGVQIISTLWFLRGLEAKSFQMDCSRWFICGSCLHASIVFRAVMGGEGGRLGTKSSLNLLSPPSCSQECTYW